MKTFITDHIKEKFKRVGNTMPKFRKKLTVQSQENVWPDGWTDRPYFIRSSRYRWGPKIISSAIRISDFIL